MAKRIPLDSVCEKKISTLPSQYEGKINYVDISSIENETKQIVSTQCLSAKEAPSRAKQLLEVGDILVSTVRPNLNAVAMVRQQAENLLVGSTGYCVLRCNDKVDKRYVFYFCQSPYFVDDMTSQATGASYPAVSSGIVKNSTIPFCPIEEQVAIADNFDKLSQLIILRKQQLAKLDELVKARFVELFGDPMTNSKGYVLKKYGDLFELNAGGTPSRQKTEYWDNGTISWIGSNMCQNTVIYENDGNYITEEGLKHSSARMFPVDTVLIALVGATIGKTALLKFETTTNQNVLGVRGIRENGYTPEFLFYYTQGLYQKFLSIGDGGFSMASKGFISELPVPVVDLALQEEFERFVKQTDKSKLAIQQSLDKLELLKKALMQKYFGEVI